MAVEKRGVVAGEESTPEAEKAAAAKCCGNRCGADPASRMAEAACQPEKAVKTPPPPPCKPA